MQSVGGDDMMSNTADEAYERARTRGQQERALLTTLNSARSISVLIHFGFEAADPKGRWRSFEVNSTSA
jgi:hypothetical protein